MPGPLLAVDAPSLLYRAFFALPKTITDGDGRPVNAILGVANLLLQAMERHDPRAVVLCHGAEAATYRVETLASYHADRPPMPDELAGQWGDATDFFAAWGFPTLDAGDLEADDLLGSLARVETEAGGTAVLFTGDRDMFQCVTADVTVLFPRGGKDGPELLDVAGVRRKYGIEPGQVPDFIALRGDPSDGIPGAKGIGEKGAAELLRAHGSLEALIELAETTATRLKPRAAQALRDQADELRGFKDMATLRDVPVERPADTPLDVPAAAAAARDRGMERLARRLEQLA